MGVMVVLFLLATTVLVLTTHLTRMSTMQTSTVKSLHMADAGLNAYLYGLRRDPMYYVSNPTMGPIALEDGFWSVEVSPPASPSDPLLVYATGSIPSYEVTRTIVAEVAFPTYAEYMFLTDADINIGSGALIEGKVRSNGSIDNDGNVTGDVLAVGTVGGSGTFGGQRLPGSAPVDFAQVTTDLNIMRGVADAAGTLFQSSGGIGYKIELAGSMARIYRVTGYNGSGEPVASQIAYIAIPSEGVIFFDERVWVSGTYSAKLTIGCNNSIYVCNHLQPTSLDSDYTCGLVASQHVVVPTWYPSLPTNLTLTAAMLAQNGSIYGDYQSGVTKNSITITGSMAYAEYGYFAVSSGSTVTAGFKQRVYSYDYRLETEPPPYFPRLRDGSLKVKTWFEE